MTTPKPLKQGDQITLISTARSINPDHLKLATETFNSWGLKVLLGQNLRETSNQFAGTDEQRAADLQQAINDPKTKAIICFRGGYGSVRILDRVDFSPLINSPKWICGYSDVTVLHQKMVSMNIQSIHSTMPVNFGNNSKEALDTFKAALFGTAYRINSPSHVKNRFGECEAEIVGGNLSIIYSLSGTDIDLNTNGKILFIEDLDEYLYHIDRMMLNLKRSGKLENLKGLIVGGMTEMNDNTIPFGKSAIEIIEEAVSAYNYPVAYNFTIGHIDNNQAIKNGSLAAFKVAEIGSTISFKED
jgi:muramoyltetrapeptide carboxypeptidase